MNPSLTGIVSGTLALLVTFTLTLTSPAPARADVDQTEMTLPPDPPADLSATTLDLIHAYLSGTNPDELTAYIETSDQLFDLSPADIDYLTDIGLPQETIAIILQRDSDTLDRLAAEQARNEPDAYPDNGYVYDYPGDVGYPVFFGPPFVFNQIDRTHRHHFDHHGEFHHHVTAHSAMAPHNNSGAMASRNAMSAGHGGGHR